MSHPAPSSPISFDARSFRIRGQRELLISGEMHYARSPRELWPALLDRSIACGLNCVASYIFWNYHEPARDVYDFSGRRDLGYFLSLCQERKLHVLLRMGPYCCAEWNYGGFPPYLRDEPGIVIRTYNEAYLKRVEKYFYHLAAEVRPYLATQGGPVILAQVENEYNNVAKRYGEEGQRYLAWMNELAARVGIDVPTITCEGGVPGTVECVNGHSISRERVDVFRKAYPGMPLLWTEFWPSWYDTWGFQQHFRSAANMAYHLLSFVGMGGCGWNYYMWHGGTNFGRDSMFLQATSYGFDAPLDEFGRRTVKSEALAKLHHLLREKSAILFEGERTEQTLPSGLSRTTWTAGRESLELLWNPQRETLREGRTSLAPLTARLMDSGGRVLFDTQTTCASVAASFQSAAWKSLPAIANWSSWREPMPQARPDGVVRASEPVEQLSLTQDASDYCWYSIALSVAKAGDHVLEVPFGGDCLYVFVDGRLVGQSRPPFVENRGPTTPATAQALADRRLATEPQYRPNAYAHRFSFRLGRGTHRLDILTTSLGLIKGDWQVSGPMQTERKGIWAPVQVNGTTLRGRGASRGWEMRPMLVGEQLGLVDRPQVVPWRTGQRAGGLTWYRAAFAVSESLLRADADFRLDAQGLGKGMIFVNGRAIGRHWLLPGHGYGPDEIWQDRWLNDLSLGPVGEPTQRFYHVPQAWLRRDNDILILEEQACSPSTVRLQVRRLA